MARSVNGGQVVGGLSGGQGVALVGGPIGGLAGGDLLEGAAIDGSGFGGFSGIIDGGLDGGCNGSGGSGGSCGGDLVAVSEGSGHGKGSGKKAIGYNGVPADY